MKIISDLIDSVKKYDCPVKQAYILLRCSFVETAHTGVASVLRDFIRPHKIVRDGGRLLDKTAVELAQYAFSEYIIEASIGVAAINSLAPIDESRCIELNAYDYIKEKGRDKNVGIIGHFPFVEKLKHDIKKLWVFEKIQREGDYGEKQIPELLPQCDLIGITATSIINHTLEGILTNCKRGSIKIILGPSTPMNPVLFDYGIDFLSGTAFIDPKAAFRHLSQGGTFQKMPGTKMLTMGKNQPTQVTQV